MSQATLKFRVGALVIGTGVLFLGLIFFILGSSLNRRLVSYHIRFDESVKGMAIGSKVNFQGIPVGEVTDIRFDAGRTVVRIDIDAEKATVQDVTSARLDRLMITGQVTVELEGYREDGKRVPPGGEIPPKMSAFDEFAQSLPELVANLDAVLASMNDLTERLGDVLDRDNRRSIKAILANTEKATGVFATEIGPLIEQRLRPALAAMEGSFRELGRVASSEDVTGALRSVRDAMQRVDGIESEVLALVQDLRGVVGGSRRSFFIALTGIRDAFHEVRMLARNLRVAPSSLLFGRSGADPVIPATPGGGR